MAVFSCDDLEQLTLAVADAWRGGADRDWSVPAGTLEWSCAHTADHAVDTVIAPAFFLASRRQDDYPDGGWSPGPSATPGALIDGLQIVTRILIGVVETADDAVRAIIWRRPQPHVAPPADFVPRAGLELALHAHDVCTGLGVPFAPPEDVSDHLREHTRHWPFWSMPGWSPLAPGGDPWADLLRCSGREPQP